MDNSKWAMVCNDVNGNTMYVDLFNGFRDAVMFMNKDVRGSQDAYKEETEYPDSIRIEIYGEQAMLFCGDEPELIWNIKRVEVH